MSAPVREIIVYRIQADQLNEFEAITRSPWCTYRDSEHFWSHRRDPDGAGRMVAYLGRPLT